MKRFIIPILFSALFVVSAQAQDKKIEFSLKGGYSYNMPNTASDTLYNSAGVHFGPMMTFNINESFGIQASLLYNYYTTKKIIKDYRDAGENNIDQKRIIAQYIDIPIKFQYKAILTDDINAYINAGPNLNYGLTQKVYYESFRDNQIVVTESNTTDDYYANSTRHLPFDLKFGVGVSLQYLKYSIYGTYDWGLLDRDKSSLKYKENNIKIGIAYTF